MKHDFYHRRAAVHLKRPRLPRITRCPCGGSRAPEHSRAERGTTPSVGNAQPNPQPYPIQKRSGWAETLIHSHPKAHPSPSKAHPKRVWLGSLQAVTMGPLGAVGWVSVIRHGKFHSHWIIIIHTSSISQSGVLHCPGESAGILPCLRSQLAPLAAASWGHSGQSAPSQRNHLARVPPSPYVLLWAKAHYFFDFRCLYRAPLHSTQKPARQQLSLHSGCSLSAHERHSDV